MPLRFLKGVGPRREAIFNQLGIYTVSDLLSYYPFRYEDRRNFKKISEIKSDEHVLIKAVIKARNLKNTPYFRRRVKSIFEIALDDGTGLADCVWFNQHYLADSMKIGDTIIIYGKPILGGRRVKFNSPEREISSQQDSLNIGRVVGVYRLPAAFNQRFIRKIIHECLEIVGGKLSDSLPFHIRKKQCFENVIKSVWGIHFPIDLEDAKRARERFIFEELFFSQILVYLRKAKHRQQESVSLLANDKVIEKIKSNLNFTLTDSQLLAVDTISKDLSKSYPMHRLLQGDVGCGKTVVAAFAIALAADCGHQAAFMVPTEVLTYQHKESLEKIFSGLNFRIEILTSSLSAQKSKKIYEDLEGGKIDIIIGTHALIQEEVKFKSLAVAVIDEQHKFGVSQRALLPKKGIPSPHCLVMSATPIPRSLALSLYGDLDLSIIPELPKVRIPAETLWVKEDKRELMYDLIKKKLKEGRQAYIVYPVIEEGSSQDLLALEKMHENIQKKFIGFNVGTFHGRMKNDQKIKVVQDFKSGKTNILLATTVIEVGVSIDNAAVMVVENPERFGLAQLHQLRGRIRRATHKPHFILISKKELTEIAAKRLKIISSTDDGFKIAEEDLKLRGPGDFFGHLQHGLPLLKIANPLRDLEILGEARLCAHHVVESDPALNSSVHRSIREHLDFWFKQ
ncbi:MAG: ATP-dependent DNA helicase RecG [Candidatus Omnitrophica bacterium]|nr:ATP-dependent DNA helicase RecG [Candidatus Omnitrophota bacterium]